MRFNESDTLLILFLLKNIESKSSIQANLDLVMEKLNNNEYIKGRILQFLFAELNKLNFKFEDSRDLQFANLLKSIKFKATPR